MDSDFFSLKPKKAAQPLIIGWRETLALPDLGVDCIKAKIDTGARTSALHAFNCQEFRQRNKLMIRFEVLPLQRNNQHRIVAAAELLEYRKITNSGGQGQIRPVIITTLNLGEYQWRAELTLTNRDVMGFRMLLGRQAVRNRFFVDSGKSFLQSDRYTPH